MCTAYEYLDDDDDDDDATVDVWLPPSHPDFRSKAAMITDLWYPGEKWCPDLSQSTKNLRFGPNLCQEGSKTKLGPC